MKTLVATAPEPSAKNQPVIMIVGGSPYTRSWWGEICQSKGYRHHFVVPRAAVRRLQEGFQVKGLVIEPDADESFAEGKLAELLDAVEASYRGPLWVADWMHEGEDEQQRTRKLLADLERRVSSLQLRIAVNDGWVNTYLQAVEWIEGDRR